MSLPETDKPKPPIPAWVSLAIDFGPAITFFAAYKLGDINEATVAVTVAAIVAAIASRILTGKISVALMVTTITAIIFGGLTIYLSDEKFVKIKSTLINLIFGGILLGGMLFKRALLKPVLAPGFPPMDDAGWSKLSRNFGWFFLGMAVINEIVWRTQSTSMWVNYNSFGDIALTMAFGASQLPIINRYAMEPPTNAEKAEIIPPQI
jgi:intracellular septation protein